MDQKLTAIAPAFGRVGGKLRLVRRLISEQGKSHEHIAHSGIGRHRGIWCIRCVEQRAAMPAASLEQSAAGLGTVSVVRHRGRLHRVYPRPRLYVTPGVYGHPRYGYVGEPLPAQLYSPTPPRFEDPGYAYHSNISGCATDLGYGRWEPCDK